VKNEESEEYYQAAPISKKDIAKYPFKTPQKFQTRLVTYDNSSGGLKARPENKIKKSQHATEEKKNSNQFKLPRITINREKKLPLNQFTALNDKDCGSYRLFTERGQNSVTSEISSRDQFDYVSFKDQNDSGVANPKFKKEAKEKNPRNGTNQIATNKKIGIIQLPKTHKYNNISSEEEMFVETPKVKHQEPRDFRPKLNSHNMITSSLVISPFRHEEDLEAEDIAENIDSDDKEDFVLNYVPNNGFRIEDLDDFGESDSSNSQNFSSKKTNKIGKYSWDTGNIQSANPPTKRKKSITDVNFANITLGDSHSSNTVPI